MASELSPSLLERHARAALDAKLEDEARGRSRITLCISRISKRGIKDKGNLTAKYLTDRLLDAGVIPADDEETINEVLRQEITKDPKEVGTLLTIIW